MSARVPSNLPQEGEGDSSSHDNATLILDNMCTASSFVKSALGVFRIF